MSDLDTMPNFSGPQPSSVTGVGKMSELPTLSKALDFDTKKIPLVECFGPTVQGEGMVIGQQTYFLRFGLCDYKCVKCDSMHAVDPRSVKKFGKFLTQAEIFEELNRIAHPDSTNWVTFSGGNPCIHDLSDLVLRLRSGGWKISVETQGTFSPEWLHSVDALVCSPKGPGMGEICNIPTLDKFVEANIGRVPMSLKIVVFDQRDLEFATDIFRRYSNQVGYDNCYLSLGNPLPPDNEGNSEVDERHLQQLLLQEYRQLYEDISTHRVLSKVKFLPQWHLFVWGNAKGH